MNYEKYFVRLHSLNRLVIHKDVTEKTLFRVLGGSIYKNHYWDIARTKEELVAYLTQFKPDIISIGPLPDMTIEQVATYLHNFYIAANMKIPAITCVDKTLIATIKDIMHGGETPYTTENFNS